MNISAILFFTFWSVFLLFFSWRRDNATKKRLREVQLNYIFPNEQSKENKDAEYKAASDRFRILAKRFLSVPAKIFAFSDITLKVDRLLTKADIPLKGEEFLAILLIANILLPLLVYAFSASILNTFLTAVLFLISPFLLVNKAGKKRLQKFDSQLVDALAIISNSMRSGFSFLQAMDMVRREMPDPISTEFKRTLREINLGMSTEEALENFTKRVESKDLDIIVTAILVQRKVGGNLAEVLDNIADTIRDRIKIKGELRALTAQGRISGIIIGLLPAALCLILMVINPGYIMLLFSDARGVLLLCLAIAMEATGVFLINKIVKIEY